MARRVRLEPERMADAVAARTARRGLPARARLGAAARVEAQTRDDQEGVRRVRVDRHPRAGAGEPEPREAARVEWTGEQARAAQGERDRARAVVGRVVPLL